MWQGECLYRQGLDDSGILNPNPHRSIVLKASRGNFVLKRVTGNGDDCISVAFKFLNHIFLLEIPQINAMILRSTYNIFPICHGERGCQAVYFVRMTGVHFQKLSVWVVPQLLHPGKKGGSLVLTKASQFNIQPQTIPQQDNSKFLFLFLLFSFFSPQNSIQFGSQVHITTETKEENRKFVIVN